MPTFHQVNLSLAISYIKEQQAIVHLQKELLSYYKLLERATIILVLIAGMDGFSPAIINQLKKAIVTKADREIFLDIFTDIRQGLLSDPGKNLL